LLARHGLHYSAHGVERILRRTPRALFLHSSNQWFSLRIAPLVRLTLSEGSAAAIATPALSDAAAAPGDRARTAVYRSIERVVQRLLHTTVHLSTPATAAISGARVQEMRHFDPAPRAQGGTPAEMPPVSRVLRQAAAMPTAMSAAQSSAAPPAAKTQGRLEIDRADRSARRPEPGLDLVRMRHELTREVVRTLDRRVIAHRERMGRT
jgi:hypothetical protein